MAVHSIVPVWEVYSCHCMMCQYEWRLGTSSPKFLSGAPNLCRVCLSWCYACALDINVLQQEKGLSDNWRLSAFQYPPYINFKYFHTQFWSEGQWFKSQLRAELCVEVSLSKILNPKLHLMCGWHLAWRPLPSARALRWAGDLSKEYPALAQRQLGLAPAKKPATP